MIETFLAIASAINSKARALELLSERLEQNLFVFDHQ